MKQPSFQDTLNLLLETVSGSENLPLKAFDKVFPQIAQIDQCYLEIANASPPDFNGRYRVVDLYCQAPTCSCHKTSLLFIDKHQNVCATISYGWKSKIFYRKWGLDKDMIQSLTSGFLDPMVQQSEHAFLFLEGFQFTMKYPAASRRSI